MRRAREIGLSLSGMTCVYPIKYGLIRADSTRLLINALVRANRVRQTTFREYVPEGFRAVALCVGPRCHMASPEAWHRSGY
jgi:hypothetical protein